MACSAVGGLPGTHVGYALVGRAHTTHIDFSSHACDSDCARRVGLRGVDAAALAQSDRQSLSDDCAGVGDLHS